MKVSLCCVHALRAARRAQKCAGCQPRAVLVRSRAVVVCVRVLLYPVPVTHHLHEPAVLSSDA